MHLIGKELEDFCVQAYHAGNFEEVTKESVLGHWSVFFFYPADFTFVCPTELGGRFLRRFSGCRMRNLFGFSGYSFRA